MNSVAPQGLSAIPSSDSSVVSPVDHTASPEPAAQPAAATASADVALRPATWRDIETLAALDAQLFEHDAWRERTWWDEFAARPRRQYVVAVGAAVPQQRVVADGTAHAPEASPDDADDREPSAPSMPRNDGAPHVSANGHPEHILGYAGLDVAGSTADVMTIAVTPEARGTGLGRRLLDHLVTAATHAGAEALLLEVRADNDPALRLYERAGFDRLTVRRRYYQPSDVDAVIMRKLLKETR